MQSASRTTAVSAKGSTPPARARACPEPVSKSRHNHRVRGYETVTSWDTCSVTPASPPTTSSRCYRSTPWSTPAVRVLTGRPAAQHATVIEQLMTAGSPSKPVDPAPWPEGIGFRSVQEAIDPTPGGKLVFHVFAALASSSVASPRTHGCGTSRSPTRPPRWSTHRLPHAGRRQEMYARGGTWWRQSHDPGAGLIYGTSPRRTPEHGSQRRSEDHGVRRMRPCSNAISGGHLWWLRPPADGVGAGQTIQPSGGFRATVVWSSISRRDVARHRLVTLIALACS